MFKQKEHDFTGDRRSMTDILNASKEHSDLDALAKEIGAKPVSLRAAVDHQPAATEYYRQELERHIRANPLTHLAWVISGLSFEHTIQLAAGLKAEQEKQTGTQREPADATAHALFNWSKKTRDETNAKQQGNG